jgi:DNA modification methylase
VSDLFNKQRHAATSPVECLGLTFPSENARREHFLNLLREKLKDASFRKTEGFPSGTDEVILAMSDPPYYTACPNPFMQDFVRHYGTPYNPDSGYTREPLAIDVQVGKTDPLYKAHSYHTKVPHLAIVPSILHYTDPGDIVLDGFCGSGMTGVAAQWCESAPPGYRAQLENEWKSADRAAPKWGARRTVLNDLSPAASFIATNYTLPFDLIAFAQAGKALLDEMATELGWMYETLHADGKTKGRIEYTVWSEVFSCPSCTGEVVFLDEALDQKTKRVRDDFPCPHCAVKLTKSGLERLFETTFDAAIQETIKTLKRKPALIVYSVDGKRFEKKPDTQDLAILQKIAALSLPPEVPRLAFPFDDMWETPRLKEKGVSHTHQLFLPRPAQALAMAWRKANSEPDTRLRNMLIWFVEQAIWGMSLLARYAPTHFSQVNQYLTGAYYVGSQLAECSPWYILEGKLKRLLTTFRKTNVGTGEVAVTVGSAAALPLPDASIDYIFTDPPFGDNLPYAELNFLVESWHQLLSQARLDAIVDRSKQNRSAQKSVGDYRRLMTACFSEYYRVLKPGHWMTVVFSNTQAAVWNSLQTALQEAGFVVANVSALDKMQGSFKSVTTTVAVKQDLVISAYKPNGGLEARFANAGGNEESAWDFVRTHLKYLPTVKMSNGQLEFVAERDPRIIFDRLVAWFVRHNFPVPVSSQELQSGLKQRFTERDGMIFLPEQAAEYDRKRMQTAHVPQMEIFVSDERSAIDWLTDFLKKRPSTYSEIHPDYIPVVGAAKKKGEVIPELRQLLEDNFIQYDGKGDVPSQIHSLLSTNFKDLRSLEKNDPRLMAKAKDRWYVPDPNKAQDLEKKREKALLKEFEAYRSFTGRKLKEFRLEVMRAGFKNAWGSKDYKTIISIAQKIPEEALQEDEKLLLWYDQALTRSEAGA